MKKRIIWLVAYSHYPSLILCRDERHAEQRAAWWAMGEPSYYAKVHWLRTTASEGA